jgi:hypothetical protein
MEEQGQYMFVPNKYLENNRNHSVKSDWSNLWFYKNKIKYPVKPGNIKHDYEITSRLSYQKDTFYKLTTMSASDPDFEYFYKLRTGAPKNIFKKNKRGLHGKKRLNDDWKNQPRSYTLNSDQKFVVEFN